MSGDFFGNFFSQIPAALIVLACAPVLVLVALIVLRSIRIRQINQREENAASPPVATPQIDLYPEPDEQISDAQPSVIDMAAAELPDLDILVGIDPPDEPDPVIESPASGPIRRSATGSVYEIPLHTGDTARARELLIILRDEDDDRLMVQIGDQGYRTLNDSPEAKKEFVKLMKELSTVINKPDDRPVGQKPTPPATRPEEPEPAPPLEPVATDEEDAQPSLHDLVEEPELPDIKTAPPPPSREGIMPGDLPSYHLDDNEPVKKRKGILGRQTKVEHQPIPEVDIGGAIETYLQYKLRHTPEYTGRELHIHSVPGGLVRIQVDDQFYDAVDDVEDLEMRAFLKATIKEWQERH